MDNFKFELDGEGVADLMKSSEMQGILNELGAQKASQAGNGYDYDVHVHQVRAVANIFPDTEEAAQDNYENNTLLKVVG